MRIAVVATLVLLALAVIPMSLSSVAPVASAPAAPSSQGWVLPGDLFHPFASTCSRSGTSSPQPDGLINVPAAGTGASATYDLEQLSDNTAVNASVTAPSGASLSTDQFILLGVGDPIGDGTFTAIGAAETYYLITQIAAPVAYLPNGTIVYSETSNFLTDGDIYTFEINHVHGYWWTYTYDGNDITGSSKWENGTYNLGVSEASGQLCEDGYTVGPTFVAIAYGDDGAATPSIPTTSVPWAIGVEPSGSSSPSYVPAAANALPQFNASLGVVGIQAHLQDSALGIDHLKVGSSVAFPGSLVPLWGNFKVLALNHSTVTPVSSSLAYSGSQIFNTTAIDENGHFLPGATYTWQYSPAILGSLNATSGTTAKFTAGTTTVSGELWVNISYNCSTLHDQANITVTPTGGPSINAFTAAPLGSVLGTTEYLNVTNGVWPRPITYHYVGLPAGCSSVNTTNLLCNATKAGTFNVRVYLNDSLGHSSNAIATFTMYQDLAITSFAATPGTLTVNTTTTFTVAVTGGVPLLTYDYLGLPRGCTGGLQPSTITCVPNATGTFRPTVFVNDTAGHSQSAQTTLDVNVAVAIQSFTASPNDIPFGGTTFLNVTAKGGTSPYSYSYHSLPAGCTSSNTNSLTCVPTVSGDFLVGVNVTDASGAVASGGALLTVEAPPNPIINSFTATPDPITFGQTTSIAVVVEGGAAPLKYAYTGLPAGCSSADQATLSCTPTAAGTFGVGVTVTDANDHAATQSLSLTVNTLPTDLTLVSFVANPTSVSVGSSTTFTVSAYGGTGALTYAYSGLPAGCSSASNANLTCAPTTTGTFVVRAFVNDTAGHSVNMTTSLTVTAAPASQGSSLLSGSLLYIVIAAVVAAVGVVAVVLVLRRKKGVGPAPPSPPAAWQEPPANVPGGPWAPPQGGYSYAEPPPATGPGAPPPR